MKWGQKRMKIVREIQRFIIFTKGWNSERETANAARQHTNGYSATTAVNEI